MITHEAVHVKLWGGIGDVAVELQRTWNLRSLFPNARIVCHIDSWISEPLRPWLNASAVFNDVAVLPPLDVTDPAAYATGLKRNIAEFRRRCGPAAIAYELYPVNSHEYPELGRAYSKYLPTTPTAHDRAQRRVQTLPAGIHKVGLHLAGSGFMNKDVDLPLEYWRGLVWRLIDRGYAVFQFGGRDDTPLDNPEVEDCRGIPLAEVVAHLGAMDAFVGVDSGPRLMALYSGTPVVMIGWDNWDLFATHYVPPIVREQPNVKIVPRSADVGVVSALVDDLIMANARVEIEANPGLDGDSWSREKLCLATFSLLEGAESKWGMLQRELAEWPCKAMAWNDLGNEAFRTVMWRLPDGKTLRQFTTFLKRFEFDSAMKIGIFEGDGFTTWPMSPSEMQTALSG